MVDIRRKLKGYVARVVVQRVIVECGLRQPGPGAEECVECAFSRIASSDLVCLDGYVFLFPVVNLLIQFFLFRDQ